MRAQLTTAASEHWGLSPGALRTEKAYVVAPDCRKLSYGELSAAAAKVTPKEAPRLKKPEEFKIIGTPQSRLNARHIATGKALQHLGRHREIQSGTKPVEHYGRPDQRSGDRWQ